MRDVDPYAASLEFGKATDIHRCRCIGRPPTLMVAVEYNLRKSACLQHRKSTLCFPAEETWKLPKYGNLFLMSSWTIAMGLWIPLKIPCKTHLKGRTRSFFASGEMRTTISSFCWSTSSVREATTNRGEGLLHSRPHDRSSE